MIKENKFRLINANSLFLIVPLISFAGGLWQGQYIYDGYHWGYIFTNVLELADGKTPYKEIYLEYGILSALINYFILIFVNKSVYSLIAITCALYAGSLYVITKITYKIVGNKFYSLFSIFIIFSLFPWPTSPWPNFYSFFFTTLFCYLYFKNKSIYFILSGVSLGLAYLSLTIAYNFIILFFYFILFVMIFFLKKKISPYQWKKLLYSLTSFLTVILIFFIYLKINNLEKIWFIYQKLPFIFNDSSIITLLKRYFYFLTTNAIKNFIYEPQWLIYSLLFYANIIAIIYCISNLGKKNIKYIFEFLVINILILSLNFYAQVLGIEKLATSISLGTISLIFLISLIKLKENKLLINFFIIFVCIYSVIFSFSLENSKIAGLRTAHLKHLDNKETKYRENNINYFKYQKWSGENWKFLNNIFELQNQIKQSCKIKYAANLTSNAYVHSLLNFDKIQIVPFFNKSNGKIIRSYIEPNLISKIQKEIDINNIFVVSTENNDLLFNLNNYDEPLKINLSDNKKKN